MRHPTRILVIGLLLLLVIASRFLYSSVPEQQNAQELNLVAGSLVQHVPKNIGWKQNQVQRENAKKLQQSLPSMNDNRNTPSMVDFNRSKLKKKEDNLTKKIKGGGEDDSKVISEAENKIRLKEEEIEKAENDLDHRKLQNKGLKKDLQHDNKAQHSPFESEVSYHDEELIKKTTLLEEKSLVPDQKEPENVSKENHSDNFNGNKNGGKKKSEKKVATPIVSQQNENNILMILAKVSQASSLAKRFKRCVLSICEHSSINLTFHIITDKVGKLTCEDTFSQAGKVCNQGLSVTYYDVDNVSSKVKPITKEIQNLFSTGSRSYFSHPLFFVSTAIHQVLPQTMKHIISLDSDLFFQTDIKQLFAIFDNFKATTIFGLAREQQPVYRHILHMYRDGHPGAKAGEPPPDGATGFNSGVMLINLQKMRDSKRYNQLLNNNVVKEIATKYTFQGHLGDQDFYSLLNLDYPEFFHVLPCSWNRQLCTWWRNHGYEKVFNLYHNCSGPIHVYHGNCNTKMPNE
ncbi:Xyloside xylosyltransferase 1 [Stylophora pistillata]|uniref:Xyloside xylosyltransferase 1 n=2 Tax=Stylophora pistillata TaxID=50429 RepID=A0A2B4S4X3_STYPI|nr:Xyloside xylosyltransferase 1 [Stylophora pistillata]